MPLTEELLGTNADGTKNEEYCIYCYKDGKFLQDCTMDEMIEHCAQFVDEVNKGLPQPITKEEYIGQMKTPPCCGCVSSQFLAATVDRVQQKSDRSGIPTA